MMRGLLPALLFLLPGVVGAQAATYTYIDQKSPYRNWAPQSGLTALNLPKIGATFRVQIPTTFNSGRHTCYYYLATGIKNPNLAIPMLNGYLFTSADVVTPAWWGQWKQLAPISFPIPNSSQLLGLHFYQQCMLFYNGIGNVYSLSRGGHGVIGR